MIVVTGATGNVGRPLVRALEAAGEQVTPVSRRGGADLTDPPSLAPAFAGADAAFLLTSGDFVAAGGDLPAVLAQARRSGVGRVVLLSSQGAGTGHHSPALEEAVLASGLPWTLLRPSGFHSNTLQWTESIRAARTAHAPFGDVALPTIDPADIAAVAAVVLRDPAHVGKTYELTGPAPISPRAQALALAEAIGEPVRFVDVPRAEARAAMVRFMPGEIADATLDLLSAPELGVVSPVVEQLLGRPGRTFAEWAVENARVFK